MNDLEKKVSRTLIGANRRCTKPNRHNYSRYGGKGIKFDRNLFHYKHILLNMLESFMDRRPDLALKDISIDRIDNKGNYEIGNLRWADNATQRENSTLKDVYKKNKESWLGEGNPKFKGYWVTPYGEFASTHQAAKETGVTYQTIHHRCLNKSTKFNDWYFKPL